MDATRVNALADDALGDSDLVDLRRRLERGEVSREELRAASVSRLEATRELNAAVSLLAATPIGDGPFAGIPLPIKDNEDVAGYPTAWGSAAIGPRPAPRDSAFVRQLVTLGFDPVAKTTMPEFGLTATTQSARFGDTRNPWDLSRAVGGSSGGAAALVAAGVVPAAHANDGGGSIRIPAAACGLVGLKPSRGRLIDRPELARAPIPLFTQGFLTRSVRDCATIYAEVERLWRNPRLPAIGHVVAPGRQRLRIAVASHGLSGIPLHAEAHAAIDRAAAICSELGHHVEQVPPPFGPGVARDFLRYWSLLALTLKRFGGRMLSPDFDGSKTGGFTNGLAAMGRRAMPGIPPALRRLRALAVSADPVPTGYDLVLGPVLGHAPPTLDWFSPDVPFRTHLLRLLRFVTSTPLDNITGAPAISLPLTRTVDGLPIGVQFAARVGREATLLELAYELEQAAPWPTLPG